MDGTVTVVIGERQNPSESTALGTSKAPWSYQGMHALRISMQANGTDVGCRSEIQKNWVQVRHSSPFAQGKAWTLNVLSAPSQVANANRDSAADWHTRQGVRIEVQPCGDWNALLRIRGAKEAADFIPWNAKESLSSMGHTHFPRERLYFGTKVNLLIQKGPWAVSQNEECPGSSYCHCECRATCSIDPVHKATFSTLCLTLPPMAISPSPM